MKAVDTKADSAARLDTHPFLAGVSELVRLALAGRDDEPAIKEKIAHGASLRVGFDSDQNVIVIALKIGERLEQLDAICATGEFAGRRVVDVAFELAVGNGASH